MTSQKKLILTKMIISLVFGLLFGGALLLINSLVSVTSLIKWAIIIAGVIVTISNIPALISGIVNINEKQGLIEFIFSALGVIMGLFMVFMHNEVITVIVAVYLIIIPVVEIILSKDRLNTLKGEWLRILIGALLVVFIPAIFSAADAIFSVILTVCAIAVIALSVISFLISLYGFLKKPVAADVIETTATEK